MSDLVGTGGARFAGPPPALNVSLGGFLLLFVASRLLYLVSIDPGYLLSSDSYLFEELYRGTIAQELVTGLTMPFTEYRANNHEGGSLAIGALAAGFFLLFGPTVFALKLAPLLVFTLALAFWYWTIQRYAGERVAQHFAVLFCFSPPLFTAHSVTAMGFHSESILFSALTVFLLFRMLSEEKPSSAYPVLLGLTAGFWLWFTYIYGLTLLALLGFGAWHEKGRFSRPRVLWFALGFLVGFSPWIVMNVQTHFAGLVIHGKNVWEHFGLDYLWQGLSDPRRLAPYEFFTNIASSDPRDLPRRAVNLLYSLLKTGRSSPARLRPTRPTLLGFSILYLVVFALAVQLSDFRATRYFLPAYPFLFFLVAHSLAYCQDLVPRVQRQIQTVFLASVVVIGLGTHAPLVSLDWPGYTLSAKGYSYAPLPRFYWDAHTPVVSDNPASILQLLQRPILSDLLPKLSPDDQRDLSRAIALLLAETAPLNGRAEDFARIERVVPPGFDKYFYYQVGVMAMDRHPNELPKAVAAVEFVRHRSAVAHHLSLVGIYHLWPEFASIDTSPESLLNASAGVAPELLPHYWRALGHVLGHWAGRSWNGTEESLSLLKTHLQEFVPRLEPSVQRSFLQGVGELLFHHLIMTPREPLVPPAELERFPHAYQPSLLEGWGMALGEVELYSPFPLIGHETLSWMAATKGFPARSLVSIQQGKAQFESLFEGTALNALKPPRQVP
jgi:hypothetical protein